MLCSEVHYLMRDAIRGHRMLRREVRYRLPRAPLDRMPTTAPFERCKTMQVLRQTVKGAGDVILLRGRAARGPTGRGGASGALRHRADTRPLPLPGRPRCSHLPGLPRCSHLPGLPRCSLFVRAPPLTVTYGGAGQRHECLRARPAPSAGNQLAERACLGPRCPWPHSPRRLPSPTAAKGRVRAPP